MKMLWRALSLMGLSLVSINIFAGKGKEAVDSCSRAHKKSDYERSISYLLGNRRFDSSRQLSRLIQQRASRMAYNQEVRREIERIEHLSEEEVATELIEELQKTTDDCRLSTVEALLTKADIYYRVEDEDPHMNLGFTPLHFAAVGGHIHVITKLLEKSGYSSDYRDLIAYDPETCINGTALHFATIYGQESSINSLCQHGANLENQDSDNGEDYGMTPLHVAIGEGHPEMISCLVGLGADLNAKSDIYETYLHFALEVRSLRAIEIILRRSELDLSNPDLYNNRLLDDLIEIEDLPEDIKENLKCERSRPKRQLISYNLHFRQGREGF